MRRQNLDPVRMEVDPDTLYAIMKSEDFIRSDLGKYSPYGDPDEYGQIYGMQVCVGPRQGIYLSPKDGPEYCVSEDRPAPVRAPWVWGNV